MIDIKKKAQIIFGDNLKALADLPDDSIDLVYIDPPFNTGKVQSRTQIKTTRNSEGDRIGFKGQRYQSKIIGTKAFADQFDDFIQYIELRMVETYRVMKSTATLYFHIDYREVHYCKVLLDGIFGRDNFLNEIIWAYDYGGRPKNRWPPKHDNILVYVKKMGEYTFNHDAVGRIPYMAPGLVGEEKAKRGKMPTDTWWHTIVSPTGKEKTGYPTQKPIGVLRRIIQASSNEGDLVLDFFAGSGTTGAAALENNRRIILVDDNEEAISVMRDRFEKEDVIFIKGEMDE